MIWQKPRKHFSNSTAFQFFRLALPFLEFMGVWDCAWIMALGQRFWHGMTFNWNGKWLDHRDGSTIPPFFHPLQAACALGIYMLLAEHGKKVWFRSSKASRKTNLKYKESAQMNRQKRNVCRYFLVVFCWSNTIVSMRVYLVKVSLGGRGLDNCGIDNK